MSATTPDPGNQDAFFGGVKARLKELCRTDHDDNLALMARALGLRQPTLWKMVVGDQPPSVALLRALARRGVNLHWLLEGSGPKRLEGADALLRGGAIAVPNLPVCSGLLDLTTCLSTHPEADHVA